MRHTPPAAMDTHMAATGAGRASGRGDLSGISEYFPYGVLYVRAGQTDGEELSRDLESAHQSPRLGRIGNAVRPGKAGQRELEVAMPS